MMPKQYGGLDFLYLNPHQKEKIKHIPVQIACIFNFHGNIQLMRNTGQKMDRLWQLQLRGDFLLLSHAHQTQLEYGINLKYNVRVGQTLQQNSESPLNTYEFVTNLYQLRIKELRNLAGEAEWKNSREIKSNRQLLFTSNNHKEYVKFVHVLLTKPIIQQIIDLRAYYQPRRVIYRGKTCIIYQGRFKENEKSVAIKSYSNANLEKTKKLQLLKEHLQILALVQNNRIANAKKIYATANSIYLIMDLYDIDLRQYLEAKIVCKIEKVKQIMYEILSAVAYLHQRYIIHGSISPKHVLIKNLNTATQKICLTGILGLMSYQKYFEPSENPESPTMEDIKEQEDNLFLKNRKNDIEAIGLILISLLKKVQNEMGLMEIENNLQIAQKNEQILEAEDLVKRMVETDIKLRLEANQALKHPFFNSNYQA